jgi:hypothetical protein
MSYPTSPIKPKVRHLSLFVCHSSRPFLSLYLTQSSTHNDIPSF